MKSLRKNVFKRVFISLLFLTHLGPVQAMQLQRQNAMVVPYNPITPRVRLAIQIIKFLLTDMHINEQDELILNECLNMLYNFDPKGYLERALETGRPVGLNMTVDQFMDSQPDKTLNVGVHVFNFVKHDWPGYEYAEWQNAGNNCPNNLREREIVDLVTFTSNIGDVKTTWSCYGGTLVMMETRDY
jgi:hypothetical protein